MAYAEAGEARRATPSWVRQIPVGGKPEAVVRGLHHPQEDSPGEIGAALRNWLQEIG